MALGSGQAQDHLIVPTLLIMSMTFVHSLTQMLVLLSLYVVLSILLSSLVCGPQVCSVPVVLVSSSDRRKCCF